MNLHLEKTFFTDKEKLFFESADDLSASLFRFESGVEAVRIQNSIGHIIVLPFKGQMIRDAVFNGRVLNMHRINRIEPRLNGKFFIEDSFGVFFFHCGALRMGSPSKEDDHRLHGELPFADYERAEIVSGSDKCGFYLGISGTYTYNRGFGPCYEAHPLIKVYSKSSLIEISMRVDNKSSYPMELMYMAHPNFRPVGNAKIVQSNKWTPEAMPMCDYGPCHFSLPEGYEDLCRQLKLHPEMTQVIAPDAEYYPEVTFYLEEPVMDECGWVHLMQVHPDGSADFMKYKPSELRYAMRWITLTGDQQGLSLAFPSTSKNEGYISEKRNGRVQELPAGDSFLASIILGYLSKEEAIKEEALINDMMSEVNYE